MIEILEPGPLTTVQDGGRNGYAALGVPRSGAFDLGAMRLANRLVGNEESAPVLEVTFGGVAMRFHDAATIALTGADCPGIDGGAALSLPAGTELGLDRPAHGLRSYLAVRGGIDVDRVLGSCSTDTLSGLGPASLRAGDRLSVGAGTHEPVRDATVGFEPPRGVVRLVLGPRDDWFDADAVSTLIDTAWTVRPESNRVGIRLDGPALRRLRNDELPSEPTLPGAVQVPPDGRPILFGPDAPTTGGYPVLGVVPRGDLDVAAQLRPGDVLRFVLSRTAGAAPRRTVPPPQPPPGS